ncbi:MAG: chemotaxis protein CheC [Proteobacteria bacterium]|nr:chemotaxis protein CheC [Pseudomonadota bacterium]
MDDIQLSELQHDAIVELLNIGMGSAASSLSEIVNKEIELSVPSLELLHRQEVIKYFETLSQEIVAIKQSFGGAFHGDALLAFSQDKGTRLVDLLMKNQVSTEKLIEIEVDAITEIGNIVLNACLATCGNVLTQELVTEIPVFMRGTATEIFNNQLESMVLFLQIKFSLQHDDIDGYVAFILETSAIEQLKANIDKYLFENI